MTAAQLLEAAQAAEVFASKLRALAGDPGAATRAPSPAPPHQAGNGARAPFGRSKGELLSTLPLSDLEWLRGALNRSIDDPEKSKYRRKNEADLANVRAELAARASGTPPTSAPAQDDFVVEGGGASDDDIPF